MRSSRSFVQEEPQIAYLFFPQPYIDDPHDLLYRRAIMDLLVPLTHPSVIPGALLPPVGRQAPACQPKVRFQEK